MRVVHLSVCRQFSRGQVNQLRYEHSASKAIKGVEWKTLGYHTGPAFDQFIKPIPFLFRLLFLRNLWGWVVAWRLSKRYDVLIMRHMTFDPFALIFAPLIPNRISVHHAKEVEELKLIRRGWRGKLASLVEEYTGRVAVRNTKMILGVTKEIAEYERATRAHSKSIGVYPNGIEVGVVAALDDAREPDEIHVAFICGTFSPWHGLDKLIQAVDDHFSSAGDLPVYIHLIGGLSDQQLAELSATSKRAQVFRSYGVMQSEEYMSILAKCDFGIGSLALERQSLSEAATLKIREMLAIGLPVYSGHKDVALENEHSWGRIVNEVSLTDLQGFGLLMKKMPRWIVRQESAESIEKMEIMKSVSKTIEEVCGSLSRFKE